MCRNRSVVGMKWFVGCVMVMGLLVWMPSVALAAGTPPSIPQNVEATATGATTVDIEWDASTDDSGTVAYRLYRNDPCSNLIYQGFGTSYSDSGLSPATSYTYWVRARDTDGMSSWLSDPCVVSTPLPVDPNAPSVPGSLTVTEVTTTTIALSWLASTDEWSIREYRLYRDTEDPNDPNAMLLATMSDTSYTDTGLDPNTVYGYAVSAVDLVGNESARSSAVFGTTEYPPELIGPSTPGNLRYSGLGETSVTVAWDASTDNRGIRYYRLFRKVDDPNIPGDPNAPADPNDASLIGLPDDPNYVDSGLDPNTSYDYWVQAEDTDGNLSSLVGPLAVMTQPIIPDTTPPSVPEEFTVVDDTIPGMLVIGWEASTDDDSGVAGYKLWRNDSTGAPMGTVSGVTFSDSGLLSETVYSYWVSAFDVEGNESAQSEPFVATSPLIPDTVPPSVPGNLRATTVTLDTVELAWDTATDDHPPLRYVIYRNGGTDALDVIPGTTFTDTGLTPYMTYTYSVKARDPSRNYSPSSNTVVVTTQKVIDPNNPPVFDSTSSDFSDVPFLAATPNMVRYYRGVGAHAGDSFTQRFSEQSLLGVKCLRMDDDGRGMSYFMARDTDQFPYVFRVDHWGETTFEAESLDEIKPFHEMEEVFFRLMVGEDYYQEGLSFVNNGVVEEVAYVTPPPDPNAPPVTGAPFQVKVRYYDVGDPNVYDLELFEQTTYYPPANYLTRVYEDVSTLEPPIETTGWQYVSSVRPDLSIDRVFMSDGPGPGNDRLLIQGRLLSLPSGDELTSGTGKIVVGPWVHLFNLDDSAWRVSQGGAGYRVQYQRSLLGGGTLWFTLSQSGGAFMLSATGIDLSGTTQPIPVEMLLGDSYYAFGKILSGTILGGLPLSLQNGYADSLTYDGSRSRLLFNPFRPDGDMGFWYGKMTFEQTEGLEDELLHLQWGDYEATFGPFTKTGDMLMFRRFSQYEGIAIVMVNLRTADYTIIVINVDIPMQLPPFDYRIEWGDFDQSFHLRAN